MQRRTSVVVHDREVFLPRVDEWTGETFDTEPFLIPVLGNDEVKWVGCYCSPSTALAAIYDSLGREYRSEYLNCAVDDFQASLVRNPSVQADSFVITVAPHWTKLRQWGGNVTLEEYHAEIKYEMQLALFGQQLPDWKSPPQFGGSYKTLVSVVSRDARTGRESVSHSRDPVDVPRCCVEFFEWVRQLGVYSVFNPNVFFVSTDPTCPGSFAISADLCSVNSDAAATLMHDFPVAGRNVRVFRSVDSEARCSIAPPDLPNGIPSAHVMRTDVRGAEASDA
jgi:hypothetical protein